MLRATTACTFSTSQLPKVVRHWCVLYILTWKCASRHNGVHFFISHLASWVRTRRFSEPTFRPSGATNHWKNTVNRDFPTFSRICIFFLLVFSLLTLLTSAFQLSILSEVSLLNFLRLVSCSPYSQYMEKKMFQTTNQIQYGGFKIKILIFAYVFVIFGATPTSDTGAPRAPPWLLRSGPSQNARWPLRETSNGRRRAHVKQPPISSMVKSG